MIPEAARARRTIVDPVSARWLSLIAALLLVAAALSQSWFQHLMPTASLGLWGAELCVRGCSSARWDNVQQAGFEIVLTGYVATVASLVSAGLVVASGGLLGGRRLVRARRALTVALVAMGLWGLFVYAFGGVHGFTALSPGWALIVGPAAGLAVRWLLPATRAG